MGNGQKYSNIKDDKIKIDRLEKIYDKGRDLGKKRFMEKYKKYVEKEKTVDDIINKVSSDIFGAILEIDSQLK
jgi:hypothetical protein